MNLPDLCDPSVDGIFAVAGVAGVMGMIEFKHVMPLMARHMFVHEIL